MSLKNVLRLAGVYARASRLISNNNFRMYSEKRWETYAIYAIAVIVGALAGAAFGYLYTIVPDQAFQESLRQAIVGFYVTLPTLSILYSLFLMMIVQIQQTGAKTSAQPLYWFPVSWREHTAASVLSSTFSGTLWITILLCSAVLVVSVPAGLLPIAVLTSVGIIICMTMTGVTMEALRVLLSGVSGVIMKAAGKAAIWVRFFTTMALFIVIFIVYFTIQQTSITVLFSWIAEGQLMIWFIPYVWPGIALYAFSRGMWLWAILVSLGSILFVAALFEIAVRLNARYGLSDAPTISVSREYSPGTGLLSRIGLTQAESAIMKKDFKAFTRRSELMYVFTAPIMLLVIIFIPFIMGNRGAVDEGIGAFFYLYIAIVPAASMAQSLGSSVVGSEGERLWLLTVSPLSKDSFIRAKFYFMVIICMAISLACCAIGYIAFQPSGRTAITGVIEAGLMVFTMGIVSLYCGIVGADFREVPMPRMMRMEWRLIDLLLSMITGALVLLPVIVYGITATLGALFTSGSINGAYLYLAWLMSGTIAVVICSLFYRMSVRHAGRLLDAKE